MVKNPPRPTPAKPTKLTQPPAHRVNDGLDPRVVPEELGVLVRLDGFRARGGRLVDGVFPTGSALPTITQEHRPNIKKRC